MLKESPTSHLWESVSHEEEKRIKRSERPRPATSHKSIAVEQRCCSRRKKDKVEYETAFSIQKVGPTDGCPTDWKWRPRAGGDEPHSLPCRCHRLGGWGVGEGGPSQVWWLFLEMPLASLVGFEGRAKRSAWAGGKEGRELLFFLVRSTVKSVRCTQDRGTPLPLCHLCFPVVALCGRLVVCAAPTAAAGRGVAISIFFRCGWWVCE